VIHSFYKLTKVNLGFRQDHLLTFSLPVPDKRFLGKPEQISMFLPASCSKQIGALPGNQFGVGVDGHADAGDLFLGCRSRLWGNPTGDSRVVGVLRRGFKHGDAGFLPHILACKYREDAPFTEQDHGGVGCLFAICE